MSSYSLPDLTGQNPDYLQPNLPYFIYDNGIKLSFENSPVFESSLKIILTDGTATPLLKDTDWRVNPEDVDQTAMSKAFLENPNFSETLIKSVTIISSKGLSKQVAVTVQEFYLTQPGRTFDDGRPFEVSVDLIKNLSTGLADVRQQVAKVFSPVVTSSTTPLLLPFDINGELSGNVIVNEQITVNTIAGAKVIRLVQGPFFADSLSMSFNGQPLNPTTDYLPVSLSPMTKQSTNKGGIYHYILLNGAFSGPVTVNSYHALGGDVQINDVNAIYDLSLAIKTFLDDSIFITSDTVVETPAFRAFNARLNLLEDNVRSLLSGNPTYGDSTAGISVVRPITATDSNFHWFTIARLYQVQGSTDIITADQFKGRVYFPGAKIALAFTADVNLTQTRDVISFTTDSLVFDPKYTLFQDHDVSAPQWPMVRLVWNQASQTFSGAMLQIGLPLTLLSDQMVVEDMSTTQSCWILDKTGQQVTGQTVNPSTPSDSGFTLPDGVSVWSPTGSSSFSKICVPKFDGGYLVYSGSTVALSQIASNASTGGLFNVSLPGYFPVSKIKALIVTMAKADSSSVYDVEVPITSFQTNTMSGRVTMSDSFGGLMGLSVTLTQDTLSNISLSLNASEITLPTNTDTTETLTDIIRYVRAKV